MLEALVLVPVTRNEGWAFGVQDWKDLEDQFMQAAGGYTQVPGFFPGGWLNQEGISFSDTSRGYLLNLTSMSDLPKFLILVDWIKIRFAQEAIMVWIRGVGSL